MVTLDDVIFGLTGKSDLKVDIAYDILVESFEDFMYGEDDMPFLAYWNNLAYMMQTAEMRSMFENPRKKLIAMYWMMLVWKIFK